MLSGRARDLSEMAHRRVATHMNVKLRAVRVLLMDCAIHVGTIGNKSNVVVLI